MFCSKCGKELNEKGLCAVCGDTTTKANEVLAKLTKSIHLSDVWMLIVGIICILSGWNMFYAEVKSQGSAIRQIIGVIVELEGVVLLVGYCLYKKLTALTDALKNGEAK